MSGAYIKPCPFCGDAMTINATGLVTHRAILNGCILEPYVFADLEAWNIRAPARPSARANVDEVEP